MKKVILFISLLFITFNVYAQELSLECPSEVKINEKVDCKVKLSTIEEVTEVSFNISNNFEVNVIPLWSHVESGGVHTFTKEGSDSTTLATLSFTPKSVGDVELELSNIKGAEPPRTSKKIKVIDVKSDNAYLSSITVNGKKVDNFNKDKKDYKVTVNTNKITIEAKAEDSKAQVSVPSGEQNLSIGEQTFTISVTSESGLENNYRLTINYEVPKNTDNSLKTLDLYDGPTKIKDFEYKNGVLTYEGIKVKADVKTIKVEATTNDAKATFVEEYGPREVVLDYGENIVIVRVQAENGSTVDYTIKIFREDNRSSDTSLSKLVVNGVNVELKDKVYEYSVKVRYNETKSHIETIAGNNASKVEYEDIDLVSGENEPVIITVTSENNTKQDYTIRIFRLSEEESKIVLEKIEVVNYQIDFSVDKMEYDIHLRDGDNKLEFVVFPNEGIKVNELNNSNLDDGSTVILRVTDDDGTKSYTFNIIKPKNGINPIICYIIFFAGLLLLTIVILIVLNKKKKNKKGKEVKKVDSGKTTKTKEVAPVSTPTEPVKEDTIIGVEPVNIDENEEI
ncbi:MAG: cadherin-like beta sandwich domain-containing protein [Bacilli bacterium]|nr:cadherin-like beta sandwich domain-containing protein [Bacilli bacterium]